MKTRDKLLVAVAAMGLLSACNGPANTTGVLIDPVRTYEVDGWGSNPDILEFTPMAHPDKTCLILVSGGDKAAGIECWDKDSEQ